MKLANLSPKQKRILLIILTVLVLVGIVLLLLPRGNNAVDIETGGAGQAPYGTLTLYNIDTPSKAGVPLGEYLSIKQIQDIQSALQAKSQEIKSLALYDAYVKDGSILIDYSKNVINFQADVKQLNTSFTVAVDLTTDNITVIKL